LNNPVFRNLKCDLESFSSFVDRRLARVDTEFSLENALSEFRAFQIELEEAQERIREAKESSRRGESKELDVEELIAEIAS
jgi:hypothetical protein